MRISRPIKAFLLIAWGGLLWQGCLWADTAQALRECDNEYRVVAPVEWPQTLSPEARAQAGRIAPLVRDMIHGVATAQAMHHMVGLSRNDGLPMLTLSPSDLGALVGELNAPETGPSMKYGNAATAIPARPISGVWGSPGGALLTAPQGEKAQAHEFSHFISPPHLHRGIAHISVVTQGDGFFFTEARTPEGEKLLKIPVHPGAVILIPSDTYHTFYAGRNQTFQVMSFTTRLLPTDSPEFLEWAPPGRFDSLPTLGYDDYLRQRFGGNPLPEAH
jgi:hypothetical protein